MRREKPRVEKKRKPTTSELAVEAGVYGRDLWLALADMVRGYEADCECRKVAPDDVLRNHTWLAMAYKRAKTALKLPIVK